MIGIFTTVYDPQGFRYFQRSELLVASTIGNRSGKRRVSRTATLDGGCSVTDGGYCVADKTIKVECPNPALDIIGFMAYIVANYNTILVCTEDGAYLGSPSEFTVTDKGALLTILITGEA